MVEYKLGQVVRSSAGRDQGDFFIVMALDELYLYLADGKNRRLESLKKKKKKHVQITHTLAEDICQKLEQDDRITNADIRNSLKAFRQTNELS